MSQDTVDQLQNCNVTDQSNNFINFINYIFEFLFMFIYRYFIFGFNQTLMWIL
jgi:hypothetical protein